MNLSHITSRSLRRILNLTERKDQLVNLVAELETEISKVLSGIVAPIAKPPAKKTVPARKARKRASSRKTKSGGMKEKLPVKTVAAAKTGKTGKRPSPLKERILSLLDAAGPKGMRVRDIAAKLGLPGGNVSVWISTTGKKLVSKVEPGVYAARGTKRSSPSKPSPARKRAKRNKSASKTFKLRKAKGK